jgi:hypothetical protein
MKITFSPTDIVVVNQQTQNLDQITILQMVDKPSSKEVKVMTKELGFITLWEGDEYDTIGQWTDIDVVNRIKELKNIQ